jgi:hypothetical protein
MAAYVTIDGYVVRKTTDAAIAITKDVRPLPAEFIWVPKACCDSGYELDVGDTDIIVQQYIAVQKELDF